MRKEVQVTCLGPLGASKNTAGLISALGRLADRSDRVATIAGDGEVAKARAQVKDLGLADRVSIPWIDERAVEALFQRTGIFVLPSLSEGLPMAILKTFSHGIAVVATPVDAIADVVQHERNGAPRPALATSRRCGGHLPFAGRRRSAPSARPSGISRPQGALHVRALYAPPPRPLADRPSIPSGVRQPAS